MKEPQFEQWMNSHPIFLTIYNELFCDQMWKFEDHTYRFSQMPIIHSGLLSKKSKKNKNLKQVSLEFRSSFLLLYKPK
jgi:hypothetical protein